MRLPGENGDLLLLESHAKYRGCMFVQSMIIIGSMITTPSSIILINFYTVRYHYVNNSARCLRKINMIKLNGIIPIKVSKFLF